MYYFFCHAAKQVGPYYVHQRWLYTCSHRPFSLSVSSVENNQHRCWLARLLIGLLPDTRPFQWVVTRDWCSALWPWESEGMGLSSRRRSSSLRTRLARECIIQQPGWVTPPDLPCSWRGCSVRIHVLIHWGFHRGRLVSLWVTPAHELIAGKSISRSTHWANWVPVFVWDDGEGVPPYRLWQSQTHCGLWLTEHVVSDFVMSPFCPFCPSTVKIWDKMDTGHK